MFRIKICGITNTDDARAVAEAGADAVGLNFYPMSSRYVSAATARTIAEALPPGIVKVGLFVNADVDVIRRTAEHVGLDLIQLHGDEPPEYLRDLAGAVSLPVMRAFRWGPAALTPIVEYLGQCRRLGCLPRLTLIDSCQPGVYGGTGTTADWAAVADIHDRAERPSAGSGRWSDARERRRRDRGRSSGGGRYGQRRRTRPRTQGPGVDPSLRSRGEGRDGRCLAAWPHRARRISPRPPTRRAGAFPATHRPPTTGNCQPTTLPSPSQTAAQPVSCRLTCGNMRA